MERNYSILLVEDSPEQAMLIKRIFSKPQYQTVHLDNGIEAYNYLLDSNNCPDVVLIDHHLPSMDGLEVMIKITEHNLNYPFIFLTADRNVDLAVEAMKAGATDYVVKSDKMHKLLPATVNKVYRLHREKIQRLELEKKLKESEEKYRNIVELSQEGIWEIDKNGKTTYVNNSFCNMLGYSAEEILDKDFTFFMDEKAKILALKYLERRKQGLSEQHDFKLIKKNGEELWTLISTRPKMDSNGAMISAIAMITDITPRKIAEQELTKQRQILNAIFDNASVGIWMVDKNNKILFANKYISTRMGSNTEKMSLSELEIQRIFNTKSTVIQQDTPFHSEETFTFLDGKKYTLEILKSKVFDDSGKLIGIVGIGIDITKRKYAENLIESLAKFPQENPFPVLRFDRSGKIRYSNKKDEELDWYLMRNFSTIFDKFSTTQNATNQQIEVKILDKFYNVIFSSLPNQPYINIYCNDITERKYAEEKIIASEQQLKEAQRIAHLGNWEYDFITKKLECSDEVFRIFGYEPTGTNPTIYDYFRSIHPNDYQFHKIIINEAVAKGTSYEIENRVICADGTVKYLQSKGQPILKEGVIVKIFGIVLDITERKHAEELIWESNEKLMQQNIEIQLRRKEIEEQNKKLQAQNVAISQMFSELETMNKTLQEANQNIRESETKFRTLFNSAGDMIFIHELDGRFVEVNESACYLLNYTYSEMLKLSKFDIDKTMTQQRFKNLMCEISEKGQLAYETQHRASSGELFPVEINSKLMEYKDRNVIISIARNITERKRQDEMLRRRLTFIEFISRISSEFINLDTVEIDSAIIEALDFVTIFAQVERGFVFLISEHEKTLDLSYEVARHGNTPYKSVFRFLNLSDIQEYIEHLQTGEMLRFKRSEELSMVPNVTLQNIINSLSIKSFIHLPLIVGNQLIGVIGFDSTTTEHEWTSENINAFKITGQMIANAITRKRAEEELLKAKEKADSANRSKSLFLANMSHEIRTPMNAILGYTTLLSKVIVDSKQTEYLQIIQASGKNLLSLINDILDLSKIEAGKMKIEYRPIAPDNIFNEIKSIFKLKAQEKGIQFSTEVDPEIPKALLIDETRLRQVLFNIVGNAVKFTDRGFVKLSVNKEYTDLQRSQMNLIFRVEDTGIGIPDEEQEEIFKAFQQQKSQGNKFGGTGLGLTITKSLVEMMNGKISVTSIVGKGSIFTIKLNEVSVSSMHKIEVRKNINHESAFHFIPAKVLVVEDNLFNQQLVLALLQERNLNTQTASNGKEALELLDSYKPDLILMDMKMPILDGYETTKIIKKDKRWNKIPIIALTAEVMKDDKERIQSIGCDGFLAKPINEDELVIELCRFLKIVDNEIESKTALPEEPSTEMNFKTSEDRDEFFSIIETRIMAEWKQYSNSLLLHRWKEFANNLKQVSEQFDAKQFVLYANKILDNVAGFNIVELKKVIHLFPDLVQSLKKN